MPSISRHVHPQSHASQVCSTLSGCRASPKYAMQGSCVLAYGKKLGDQQRQRACEMVCSQTRSFSYSVGSKLVMPPPLTPLVLCSSHHSIILSYARAACSSWSKHPSDVGFPLRLHGKCDPAHESVRAEPSTRHASSDCSRSEQDAWPHKLHCRRNHALQKRDSTGLEQCASKQRPGTPAQGQGLAWACRAHASRTGTAPPSAWWGRSGARRGTWRCRCARWPAPWPC